MLRKLLLVWVNLFALSLLSINGYGQTLSELSDPDADGVDDKISLKQLLPLSIQSEPIISRTMLIDRSHGQNFDVSGFTNYLVSEGWTVDALFTRPVTLEILSGYDVFMIPYTSVIFLTSEIDAVTSYVQAGGGIWVFGEYEKDLSGSNSVASQFGVTFNIDMVYDPTNHEGASDYCPTIHVLETHPITNGVSSFGYYAGCSLNVSNPAEVIAKGDDDAYSIFYTSYPPVLVAAEYGMGHSVFMGDITPLHPNYYPNDLREEEKLLLSNIVEWLYPCPVTLRVEDITAHLGDVSFQLPVSMKNLGGEVLAIETLLVDEPNNLTCTGCVPDPVRASEFICFAQEQDDGGCKIVMVTVNADALIGIEDGTIFTVDYTANYNIPSDDCITITPLEGDTIIADVCEDPIMPVCVESGEICYITCGDVYPSDTCGDGVVNIFDILEEIDIVLGIMEPLECQETQADVPTGLPTCADDCTPPDDEINIFDILVLIDKALERVNCCDCYYFGECN